MAARRCVLLADAHADMREGVRRLLEGRFATSVMVADEPSLMDAAVRMEPDLVVVDLSLPASGGANLVRTLCDRCPGLKVIVLSVHDEPTVASRTLGAGAAGFVLKRTAVVDLPSAVEAVLRGETYSSPTLPRPPEVQGDG